MSRPPLTCKPGVKQVREASTSPAATLDRWQARTAHRSADPLKQIAKLRIFTEHIKAFAAAETLAPGGMLTAVHASRQGAALEAVPA